MLNKLLLMSSVFFLLGLIITILIMLISNNWIMTWAMLEINLCSFIPLIMIKKNLNSSCSPMMTYLIIQSISSSLILFSVMNILSSLSLSLNLLNMMIFMLGIFIKIALFPFHQWYINLIDSVGWLSILILMTLQKVMPLVMIDLKSYLFIKIFLMSILINSIISSFVGIKQMSIKKIMGYSSLNQMSWLILVLFLSEMMATKYFFLYVIISMKVIIILSLSNMGLIIDLIKIRSKSTFLMLMIGLISLGGIPPMFGFLLKWMIIDKFCSTNLMFVMIMLLMLSLMVLFFYLMIVLPSSLIMTPHSKLNSVKNFSWLMFSLLVVMIYLLLINSMFID